MSRGQGILKSLDKYSDCGGSIRKALSNPTPENERDAFSAVKANVEIINQFFQFSKELGMFAFFSLISPMVSDLVLCVEREFPASLKSLASEDEKSSISEQQAISKKIADVMDFVLKFDELKMQRPGLQNDFSFYRRSLGKHSSDPDLVVRDDEASFISLFIAQPIPMMTALAKATSELLNESSHLSTQVPKVLATIANVCLHLVKSKKIEEPATNMLAIRAMVGSIVLFDHISTEGAFVKRSGINIRQAVLLVVREYSDQKPLINALRYSTLHFSDDSTPSSITSLLENA